MVHTGLAKVFMERQTKWESILVSHAALDRDGEIFPALACWPRDPRCYMVMGSASKMGLSSGC